MRAYRRTDITYLIGAIGDYANCFVKKQDIESYVVSSLCQIVTSLLVVGAIFFLYSPNVQNEEHQRFVKHGVCALLYVLVVVRNNNFIICLQLHQQ